MSRSFVKPSVTPLTAFWARARAIPWKARCWRSSFVRLQVSSAPSREKEIPGGTGVWSLPFGPCTSRAFGDTCTFTPWGMAITLRPTRDMAAPLPDVAEDLAADALASGAAAGHEPARGGEDVDPEAALHPGDLVLATVDPAARAA